jgi:hypothetical protein
MAVFRSTTKLLTIARNLPAISTRTYHEKVPFLKIDYAVSIFVREHGVHAGPKDYFVVVVVVVVVVVICGSI